MALGNRPLPLIDKNALPSIPYDAIIVTEQDNSFGAVLHEAIQLNLDINKFVLDRTICTYGFSFELYQKLRRSRLSIISMNNFGERIGYTFGLPGIGVDFLFSENDFFKFILSPFKYINSELRVDESKKFFLSDIELKTSYADENFARMAWHNWRVNFNPFNTLVVMYTEKPEILAEFDKLPYAKKICFVPFETKLESGFYVKPYYVQGRPLEEAVSKIAANKTTCFNLWDILLHAKKTPVNMSANDASKTVKPSTVYSSIDGKISVANALGPPAHNCEVFIPRLITNYVGGDKEFTIFFPYGDHRFVRTYPAKNKIFYTGEEVFGSPHYEGYEDHCINDVDLALGFEYIDSEKYIRLPLWLNWNFEPKLDMELIKNEIAQINAARSTKKYECVSINSHDGMNTRTPIYEKLKNVLQIKCAGKWNNNTNELHTVYHNNKLLYVHEFIFNICPENGNRFGYVSEKLFDSFIAGAIPIYYGSDNNPEEGIINKNAVLFFDPKSDNDELVKEVIRLKADEDYYEKFMRQEKLFSKNAAEYIYTTLEKIVKRLKEM